MSTQKYPIGLQDFKGIIENGFVYVDKTKFIHQLITSHKYYFLSRPRRFGKSVFLSSLYHLFQGKKELFKGLFIEDKWDFEEYPIVRISFSAIAYENNRLSEAIEKELNQTAKHYQISLKSSLFKDKFRELIHELFEKYNQQVVVLIDEYDKPLIDYLDKENVQQAIENRTILKSFYSVLKDADPYLKLVFITGVSKFTQVSLFSDLNNINDISMDLEYNEICGISQEELDCYFIKELEAYDRDKIKEWYNGYRWHIEGHTLYNPFSILNFFAKSGEFSNYWFATGTPTFLMKMSKEMGFYKMKRITASSFDLHAFDIDNILVIPVLFQTGYLTILEKDPVLNNFILTFPNREVEEAYLERLADTYIQNQLNPAKAILSEILLALREKNPAKLKNSINLAFEKIPYPLWQKENEHFYHAIVHLLFSLMGIYIQSEVHTKDGRADAIINIEEGIFCLEFKLDKSANEAIEQVREKGYLNAYLNNSKPCYIIGINFSSEKKAIEELVFKEL
jgi:hypothetical protein